MNIPNIVNEIINAAITSEFIFFIFIFYYEYCVVAYCGIVKNYS